MALKGERFDAHDFLPQAAAAGAVAAIAQQPLAMPGLVVADTVEWPRLGDVTADFVYARLHGSEQLYASGYSDKALDDWARWFRSWQKSQAPREVDRVTRAKGPKVRDIFVYFDNDMKVRAPFDAKSLAKRLKVKTVTPPLEDFVQKKKKTRGEASSRRGS